MSTDDTGLHNAALEWQDGLPRSRDYGDIYFSGAGLEETAHVFLAGNDLAQRWRALATPLFRLGECGFGSGLNFLCAWRLWEDCAPPGRTLHYLSCEKHPLRLQDLCRVHAQWPELAPWAGALQHVYPQHSAGLHRLHLGTPTRPVILDLLYGDAESSLADLAALAPRSVDAWFLDGFAPARNPGMWSPTLLRQLAALSRPGTSFATYTVAAAVRNGLAEAGFSLEKAPGHGGKRHMLKGRFQGSALALEASATPWFNLPPMRRHGLTAVIGGGMAGCATAWALARKGIPVVLIEREARVATGASGNPQGALYLKLGKRLTPGLRFLLQAWLYARRHYPALQTESGVDLGWAECGLLQLARNAEEVALMRATAQEAGYAADVLRAVDAAEAAALAGLELSHPGLWLPGGALLSPAALCEAYLRHEAIETQLCREALALERRGERWALHSTEGLLLEADAVVVAAAVDSLRLPPCAHYPLSPVRGQLSYFPASQRSNALRTILCTQGYVLPARGAQHCVGATFTPRSSDTAVHEEDHRFNLSLVEGISSMLHEAFAAHGPVGGRAALRCVSRDHLPLAGPVEDVDAMLALYGDLRRNARRRFEEHAAPLPGLFINTAHGSHGLTSTPLAAEYIASLIAGETPPLQREQVHALHPARFLIRRLKRREV